LEGDFLDAVAVPLEHAVGLGIQRGRGLRPRAPGPPEVFTQHGALLGPGSQRGRSLVTGPQLGGARFDEVLECAGRFIGGFGGVRGGQAQGAKQREQQANT